MDFMEYSLMNPVSRFFYKFTQFFKHIPQSVANGFKAVGRGFSKLASGFVNVFKNLWLWFSKGDFKTKLSFLIAGSGNFLRGQILKGLMYLSIEVSVIAYFIYKGAYYVSMLPTLGVNTQNKVFDDKLGIYIYTTGDNSMLLLLFGVITLFVLAAYLFIHYTNIKSAYNAQLIKKETGKLPSAKEELKMLFDSRYHITLLSLPSLGIIAFTVLPLVFMILIAFTNFDKNHQPPGNLFTWVGLQNFKSVLWENPVLSDTLGGVFSWTIVWAIFSTFTNYIFGMILAIVINKKGIKLKGMWRTIFVITIAVPQFVSLLLMSKLLNELGPVNVLLQQFGWIDSAIPFLTDTNLARITVIVVNMWVGIPYTMLTTTGILMNIPEDLYESARLDGANAVQTFTNITLPYMLFVTAPSLITQFVNNINNFNVIYLLSNGGPLSLDYYQAGKTDLLVTWLYKLTVNQQNYNLGSTIGIIVFVISAVLSLIVYNRTGSVKKEEEFQ